MLRDVVAGFLDTVTEREFDAPLLALLAARRFTGIHFLHGKYEFGKDVIAKGLKPLGGDTGNGDPATWTLHQYSIQSKAGDIGLPEWRAVRPQIDEARLDDLAHPDFDTDLPRAAVLLTTGRLTGGAPVEAGSYLQAELRRGRPGFETWDREHLLDWLVSSPEAGLAGTSDGPILALAGAIDASQITYADLERRGRAWLPPVPGTLTAATEPPAEITARLRRAAIEAAVLGNRLRRSGRLDLAALTALYCCALPGATRFTSRPNLHLPVPRWRPQRSACSPATPRPCSTKPSPSRPMPLRCSTPYRRSHSRTPPTRQPASGSLRSSACSACSLTAPRPTSPPDCACSPNASPALSRICSPASPAARARSATGFAISLIAPVLLTARRDLEAARDFLTQAAVWAADRYDPEHGGIGLAGSTADPGTEVAYLLGAPFNNSPAPRPGSYVATVLTDLAAVLPGSAGLYEDLVNEFLAAGADPQLLQADELRAQWRPDGPGVTLTPRISYAEPFPPDGTTAPHYAAPAPPVPAWDALALTSVTRDRHVVAVLRVALGETGQRPG